MSLTAVMRRYFAFRWFLQAFLCALLVMGLTGLAPSIALAGSRSGAGRAVAKAAQRNGALAYRFVPGTRMIYRLGYTSVSASDFRALLQGQQPSSAKLQAVASNLAYTFKTAVEGEWEITLLARKADSVLARYRLRAPSVRLNVNGLEAAAQAAILQEELCRDIYALLDLRGRVVSVWLDPALGSTSQSYARTLLALTQCVLPVASSPGMRVWQTHEDDPSGAYIARYQTQTESRQRAAGTAPADLKTFRKTKVGYLPPRTEGEHGEREVPTTIRPQGSFIARFDGGAGRLLSLAGAETLVQIVAGKMVAHAQTVLQLEYLRTETLTSAERAALQEAETAREKTAPAVALSVMPSRQESEAIVQRTRLGTATLESLFAELAQAEAAKDPKADDTPLYLQFKALIFVHPETSASLGKLLATAAPGSLTLRLLTGALSAVGHPQAQAALVAAIRARLAEVSALVSLVPALGMVDSPTQQAEEVLRELALRSPDPDIASMAQLCLGIVARRLAHPSPERARKILTWMTDRLASSRSAGEQRQLLLALGNAGSTRALPTIARFVTAPSPALRAAAAAALRWVASRQADTFLADRLRSDPDVSVRAAAAFALSFRTIQTNTYQAQKRALLADASENVRQTVLANLWKARGSYPAVRALLKAVRSRDASKEIRKSAAEMLAQDPLSSSHPASTDPVLDHHNPASP